MPFTTHRRVEFRDTDAAGIAHFSVFFPMMETAEHEMLRSLGVSVLPHTGDESSALTWPRVAASCDYRAAARFEDLLAIEVRVGRVGNSSVRYEFAFTRDAVAIADGSLTAVCCRLCPGGPLEKVAIPDDVRVRLERMC
jgi:4-hydroxybenzoyl-CoA thioesterase/acyl-CoA thioester hydrolase